MKMWISNFWNDPAFFERAMSAVIFFAGEAVRMGVIPTGVNGLGPKLAPFISAAAVYVAAGRTTKKA